ncbi:MAG TPA: cytochrome c biogenesis protein ResB [Chthoniobacteraceae bacterium]|jgi:hypothetical protein|nr:cytochrome c biogenesis protein ResB [Chthoniobacteraceae bacterium]
MKENLRQCFDFISSLKLTIFLLAASLVLVFAGTIAQVHLGVDEVQKQYFQSMWVWCPVGSQGLRIPIYPGGHLLGAILLVNLVSAHLRRFRWTWRKLGIHFIHAGLVIMLAGGLFTDLFSVESYTRLGPGEAKNYSEDSRKTELAVIDESNKDYDQVTAIPDAILRKGGTIEHASLPFRIVVGHFYDNSQVTMMDQPGAGQPAATQGIGAQVSVSPLPVAASQESDNVVSAVIEIVPQPQPGEATAMPLGSWLVSEALGAPQQFAYGGRTWRLELRPRRYYTPYTLTLQKFTHQRYAGTDIAKNYASLVTLIDPSRSENRDVLIYMNHPLRYRGETFYQSGFDKNDTATILQSVHNPTFLAPYVACAIVGAGLLLQFALQYGGFSRRHKSAPASC